MKKLLLFLAFVLLLALPATAGSKVPYNWKSWDSYPDVPRISAAFVAKTLLDKEEKIVLIYAGYEKSRVICSSIFLPYNLVPPHGSGARINLPDFPKDTLMVAY